MYFAKQIYISVQLIWFSENVSNPVLSQKYFQNIPPWLNTFHLFIFYFLLVSQVISEEYDDEVALDTIKHMNEAGNW